MLRLLLTFFVSALMLAAPLHAQERVRLGYGLLFTNDEIGDGNDRWRTGSIATSRIWGTRWTGQAPARLGQLIELRFNGQIISPESLRSPSPADRPYAGVLTLGLHTHAHMNGYDLAVGADLALTGPATGLDDFQELIHDILSGPVPSDSLRANQIGNGLHPSIVFELARPYTLGNATLVRPFIEAQAGIETYVRAGVDVTIGGAGDGELHVRAPVPGFRYRVIKSQWTGTRLLLGADITHVFDSEFLPSDRSIALEDTRTRLRAGFRWQGDAGQSLFYGLTWLSEEFVGQRETQLIGSLQFKITF